MEAPQNRRNRQRISKLKNNPKIHSLAEEFSERLQSGGGFCEADPDYLGWVEKAIHLDFFTCSENYDDPKLSEKERAAWHAFNDSIEASAQLMELYKKDAVLFQKIARQISLLPCLISWHPAADAFNRRLLKSCSLGKESLWGDLTMKPGHLAHQSWPTRYAYAIISTIDLTLDCEGEKLPMWAELYGYGGKREISRGDIEAALARMNLSQERKQKLREQQRGACQMLPKWTKGLTQIAQPITPRNVLSYWRVGKEIIREEMPAFHTRPEWKNYRARKYATGAKKGAIQHAIFKDILAALKTIAGANKRETPRTATSHQASS